MEITCLISMTLCYPNPGQADQGRVLFYLVSMPNNSIRICDITRMVHDMPISSTEHPHPRLWANHHMVVAIVRFARAGREIHSIPKSLDLVHQLSFVVLATLPVNREEGDV